MRASLLQTLDNAIQYRDYDAEIRFSRPYRLEAVTQVAENVKGVAWVEVGASASVAASGTTTPRVAASKFLRRPPTRA